MRTFLPINGTSVSHTSPAVALHACLRPFQTLGKHHASSNVFHKTHIFEQLERAAHRRNVQTYAGPPKICVVGAGVVGLTSALRLLQEMPHAEITLLAEKFGTDTTTAGAAGIWGPYKLSDTPEEDVIAWGKETYNHLMQLFYSSDAAKAGVSVLACHWLNEHWEPEPFWKEIVHNFAPISKEQLKLFPSRYISGFGHTSIVCEGRYYLSWLTQQIKQRGGSLQQARLQSLQQLASSYTAVVDCCGLGAVQLLNDREVYPIRGQIIRVQAPWVTCAYMTDPFYIIPNRNFVILGGTGQVGDWNQQASLADKERIWKGCCSILPSLEQAEVLEDWVGLRPGRTRLRLELSMIEAAGAKAMPVVHNYGHGGAGLTLAWGCAADVVKLMKAALHQ